MYSYNYMQKRRLYLSKEIERFSSMIDLSQKGKIELHKDHNGFRWMVVKEGEKRKYLSKKERGYAITLAKNRVLESRIEELKKEMMAIDMYLNHCVRDENVDKRLQFERKFYELSAVDLSDATEKMKNWADAPFQSNPSFPENLKHPSPSGHILRSKSECLIDMQLYYRKIPFRYEAVLSINGEEVYPDFTFYKPSTGEFRYWEHCGMFDNGKYRKRALEKMDFYSSNGLYPDSEIIYTFETTNEPLTVITIDKIIDRIEDWLND